MILSNITERFMQVLSDRTLLYSQAETWLKLESVGWT
jgi:hypothetical protein